jgi:hypothetical protein
LVEEGQIVQEVKFEGRPYVFEQFCHALDLSGLVEAELAHNGFPFPQDPLVNFFEYFLTFDPDLCLLFFSLVLAVLDNNGKQLKRSGQWTLLSFLNLDGVVVKCVIEEAQSGIDDGVAL